MPQVIIDNMNEASQWQALMPDGLSPSSELIIVDDITNFINDDDRISARITATTAALAHLLRRSFSPVNLSGFEELRFWIKSNRVADGSSRGTFFLELKLGSSSITVDNPGNSWYCYVPVMQKEKWELVCINIRDLSLEIKSALNQLQLKCIDASISFIGNIDLIIGIHEEMIGDVDTALTNFLHQKLILDSTQVPATINHPDAQVTLEMPYILITHYDTKIVAERGSSGTGRSNFTATGLQLRPSITGYDLYYKIDAHASTRQEKTRIMEFILLTLAPRKELLVNGIPLPVEIIEVPFSGLPAEQIAERSMFHFRIQTRQVIGLPQPATIPFQKVEVEIDQK